MLQGFSNFSVFLYHFVLAKLATSSVRVNRNTCRIINSWKIPVNTLRNHHHFPSARSVYVVLALIVNKKIVAEVSILVDTSKYIRE